MLTGGWAAGIAPLSSSASSRSLAQRAPCAMRWSSTWAALRGAAPCAESAAHGHGEVPAEGAYEKDEVGRLREEAEDLQQQLNEVMERLNRLRPSGGTKCSN